MEERTVFDAGRLQVAKKLRHMFMEHGFHRLEFQKQGAFNQHIGHQVAKQRPVLIINFDCDLLFHTQSLLPQTMHQGVRPTSSLPTPAR